MGQNATSDNRVNEKLSDSDSYRLPVFSNQIFGAFLVYGSQVDKKKLSWLLESLGPDSNIESPDGWSTAEELEKFLLVFSELFGKESVFRAAKELYEKKRIPLVGSALGLVVNPKLLFSRLNWFAGRLNRYNSYHFKIESESPIRVNSVLSQYYSDPSKTALNAFLKDCCYASCAGTLAALGYTKFTIVPLVNDDDAGADHFQISWPKRGPMLHIHVYIIVISITFLVVGVFQFLNPHLALGDLIYLTTILLISTFAANFLIGRSSERKLSIAFIEQQENFNRLREAFDSQMDLNKKLVDYQQRLEASLRLATLGEASFGIIHDMASPITVLDLACSKLKRKERELLRVFGGSAPAESPLGEVVTAIEKSTASLLRMQKILRLSVAEGSIGGPMEFAQFKPVEIVDPLVKLLAFGADKFGIEIQFYSVAREQDLEIHGDELALTRIITNSIQNSINVLKGVVPQEGLKHQVRIVLWRDEKELFIVISDSGPGFPSSTIKELEQLEGSVQTHIKGEVFRGAGFGLKNIKKLVKEMRGHVSFYNRKDLSNQPFFSLRSDIRELLTTGYTSGAVTEIRFPCNELRDSSMSDKK